MPTPLLKMPENDPVAFRVRTFTALVEEVGRFCAQRQHDNFLFRGQAVAYVHPNDTHSLRPRIYRHGDLQSRELERFLKRVRAVNGRLTFRNDYARPRTAVEALFAHYERYDTRMLDVTHVLHVAASFALAEKIDDFQGPSVVYMIDVRGGRPKPSPGGLGKALVAATTEEAATRPMRQAAWVIWEDNAGVEIVDFGDKVRRAFLISEEDKPRFWDCQPGLARGWLMNGDEMLETLRRP